jgi:hypothetical protein
MTEIALQLAIYSRATHWYDPTSGQLHPMPNVDQDKALVMHLPVGKATCTLYEVDIAAGWDAVQLALDVRAWRQRKDLASMINVPGIKPEPVPVDPDEAAAKHNLRLATHFGLTIPDGVPGADASMTKEVYGDFLDRLEWVRDRVQAIKQADHGDSLAALWSQHPDIPTFPKGGPRTPGDLDEVIRMCDLVEAEHDMPFGQSDPTIPVATKSTRKRTTT